MDEVLSACVDAGATHIHGVTFKTTKLREHCEKARALAIQAAREKARDLSAAAGLQIGKPIAISSVNYGGGSSYGAAWHRSGGSYISQIE